MRTDLEPAQVRTVIDSSSEADFLWRTLREHVGFRARVARHWLFAGHFVRAAAIRRYLAGTNEPKLHLGATHEVSGFLNSQILGRVPIDVAHRMPVPDDTFTLIYSSHLVEHLHRREFHRFLADGLRVLRPGGVMIAAAPSAEKIARYVYGPDSPARQEAYARGMSRFVDPVHTSGHHINLAMRGYGHRFLYDSEYMRWVGAAIGYAAVETIGNFAVPDDALRRYLVEQKPPRWDLQTETWVFRKA